MRQRGRSITKAASKQEGPNKFGVPDKKTVFLSSPIECVAFKRLELLRTEIHVVFFPYLSFLVSELSLVPMVCIPMYTYGMYIYGMYTYVYLWYVYLWYVYLIPGVYREYTGSIPGV